MKSTKRTVFMIVVLGVMVFVTASIYAEEKQSDNMQILIEKVKADKKLLVAQNMKLTDAEAKAFWPVYEQYQDELFLLRQRANKMIKDYAADYNKMTDATAKKLLDEYLTIETLRLKLRQAYLPKFRKVLPEIKVARYYQIENKINAALLYVLAGEIPLMETPN